MPAGAKVLPYRSNIPAISRFVFAQVDETYPTRTDSYKERGHFIVAGSNYGQGSSREHAAIAPRYLGVVAVIAKSFARIHRANLANFGIVPLLFSDAADYQKIWKEDILLLPHLKEDLKKGKLVVVKNVTQGYTFTVVHNMSSREVEAVLAGGLIERFRKRK